jgi:LPS export ABC transporter protein LptC
MNRQLRKYFNGMVFLLLNALLICSCENNEKDLPAFRKKKPSIGEGRDIVSYLSENSVIKAKLTAPYMLRNEGDTPFVEFPKSLHVDFYNDSLQVESLMDALYGKYRESENKVFLRDSVVVKNIIKGDTMHCRELWWDKKEQRFYTDKAVRINKKGGTVIYGIGFEAPQDFSGYTIFQVTGPLAVEGKILPK